MAQENEIERMVVRLIGDAKSYLQALEESKRATKEAADKMNTLTGRVKALAGRMKGFAQGMGNVGRRMSLMITAPLAAMGGMAVKMSMDFNEAMSRITGLVGISSDKVAVFRQEILRLAPEVGKSPAELAEALFFITSAGLRGEQALEALRVSAKAAAGGMGSTKSVADAATSAMNAYGASNLSATRSVEILTAAVRAGKADAASFAPQFGQLLPLAKELKVDFGQVAGAMAFLTKTTGNASLAATGFKGILRAMVRPPKDVTKKMEELGISIDDIRQKIATRGLHPALMMLKSDLEKAGLTLTDFFTDTEGLVAALQMTGDAAGDAAQVIEDVSNSVGIVESVFGSWNEQAKAGMVKSLQRLHVLWIELGEVLSPVMSKMISFGEVAMGVWQRMGPVAQRIVINILATVAAIGPLLMIGSRLTGMVAELIEHLPRLVTWLSATNHQLLLCKAGMIGLAVVGIALVTTKIYQAMPAIKEFNAQLKKSADLSDRISQQRTKAAAKIVEGARERAAAGGIVGAAKEIGGLRTEIAVTEKDIVAIKKKIEGAEKSLAKASSGSGAMPEFQGSMFNPLNILKHNLKTAKSGWDYVAQAKFRALKVEGLADLNRQLEDERSKLEQLKGAYKDLSSEVDRGTAVQRKWAAAAFSWISKGVQGIQRASAEMADKSITTIGAEGVNKTVTAFGSMAGEGITKAAANWVAKGVTSIGKAAGVAGAEAIERAKQITLGMHPRKIQWPQYTLPQAIRMGTSESAQRIAQHREMMAGGGRDDVKAQAAKGVHFLEVIADGIMALLEKDPIEVEPADLG